jgi:hypothetical protein
MVENHTEQDGTVCKSCHQPLINPYGFPFENYDAVGAWRDMDNGFPVDAAETPWLDGATVEVENAVELMNLMATSVDAHRCYTSHWMEFANGRPLVPEDDAITDRLGAESVDEDLPIAELIVRIATSKPFRNRNTEELQ